MTFGSIPVSVIQRIGIYQRTVRNSLLQVTHHISGENIGAILLAGVELDCHLSGDTLIYQIVQLYEMLAVNMLRIVDHSSSLSLGSPLLYQTAANDRGLRFSHAGKAGNNCRTQCHCSDTFLQIILHDITSGTDNKQKSSCHYTTNLHPLIIPIMHA